MRGIQRRLFSLTARCDSSIEAKQWCCLFEGGFRTPCGTCPLPAVAQRYFRQEQYASSADWRQGFRRDQQRNANRFTASSSAPVSAAATAEALAQLGLFGDVSRSEVKRAFRQAALLLHPDKENGSEKKFVKLVEAYECLMRTVKR